MAKDNIGQYRGVDINPGDKASIAAQIAAIDAQNGNTIDNGAIKPIPAPTTLNSTNTAPATAIPLPSGTQPTPAMNDLNFTASKIAEFAPTTVTTGNQGSSFLDSLNKLAKEGAVTEEFNTQEQVDAKKKAIDAINAETTLADRAYQKRIREIQGNGGITAVGAAAEQNEVTRQYNFDRADRAIAKSVALQDYETAVSTVDRKVKAIFEPLRNNIDNLMKLRDYTNSEKQGQLLDQQIKKAQADYNASVELGTYAGLAGVDARASGDPNYTPQAPTSYTVTSADTGGLYSIAQKIAQSSGQDVNTVLKSLQDANPQLKQTSEYQTLKDPYPIKAGDIITLPSISNPNPTNGSILSATGLSSVMFNYMTQGTSALTRLNEATRTKIMRDADTWARAHGTDTATLQSQYEAYNKTLMQNISRNNNTKIAEQELLGTIDNLSSTADSKEFGKLKVANVAKLFAGEQVNDPLTLKYAIHLNQLRTELAYYNAAVSGNNSATINDFNEAGRIIANGLSSGSLKGFQDAITSSTEKMAQVLQGSVDRAAKSVWDLFGVGSKYQSKFSPSDTFNMSFDPLMLGINNIGNSLQNNPLSL